MSAPDPREVPTYLAASIALNGVVPVLLLALWVCSFRYAYSAKDAVQGAFVWMKVAIPLFALSNVLYISATIHILPTITLVMTTDADYGHYEIPTRLGDLSWLLKAFGHIALTMCFVDLTLGLRGLAKGELVKPQRVLRCSVLALMGAAWVLAIVYYAFESKYVGGFYEDFVRRGDLLWFANGGLAELYRARRLQGAFVVLLWLTSLLTAGMAAATFVLLRRSESCKKMAGLGAIASIVWLVPNQWELAYQICWLLRDDYDSRNVPMYVEILRPVLGSWPTLAVLVLVFLAQRTGRKIGATVAMDREQKSEEASDAGSTSSLAI